MLVRTVVTGDGSHSLFVPELNEHYHSTFGAIQESEFIFINAGLKFMTSPPDPLSLKARGSSPSPLRGWPGSGNHLGILEIGFGTGLNALLTQIDAEESEIPILYSSMKAYPLARGNWTHLNYPEQTGKPGMTEIFSSIHKAVWNEPIQISPHFTLHKIHGKLQEFDPGTDIFDLVYFDAFGPDAQPELWTAEIFAVIFQSLKSGGILVTYSVKGSVVRALRSAGFATEKLPGPPGKRHILRAVKP